MTIAITGPDKYRFQDLACARLAMDWSKLSEFSLIPEAGSEDAQVSFVINDARRIIEVQVKGGKQNVTEDLLAGWLAHFAARTQTNCLFKRLLDQPELHVLFIATGRANDWSSTFLQPDSWRGESREHLLADTIVPNFLRAWNDYGHSLPTNTKAKASRRTEVTNLLSSIHQDDIRGALSRVHLLEQETTETLEVHIQGTLSSEYRVPGDRLRSTVAMMLEDVRLAKSPPQNAAAAISKRLSTLKISSLTPKGYVQRAFDVTLSEHLSLEKAILISGSPRTGKSWSALHVAQCFAEIGYEVQRSADVSSAQRFLTEPVKHSRLYILDDPFGHRDLHTDHHVIRETLSDLLLTLGENRRLIVVQGIDPLLRAFRAGRVEECAFGRYGWHDIARLGHSDLSAAWASIANAAGMPVELQTKISGLSEFRNGTIEIGALAYLASNYNRLTESPNSEDILVLARSDASSIGITTVETLPGSLDLLLAIALGTDHGKFIETETLAFAISDSDEQPSRDAWAGMSIGFGADRDPVELKYDLPPTLTQVDKGLLEALETRRLIVVSNAGVEFSHPFYRAAAQHLFNGLNQRKTQRVLELLTRILFSLSVQSSNSVARNLTWLNGFVQEHARLREIAEIGLESLFPRTRDHCFAYLTAFHTSDKEGMSKVSRWMHRLDLDITHLMEVDGAVIVDPSNSGAEMMRRRYEPVEYQDIRPWVEAMAAGTNVAPSLDIVGAILRYFSANPQELTESVALRVFANDLAAVRGEITLVWLSVVREQDDVIRKVIFGDTHPTVVRAIYSAAEKTWHDLPRERQDILVSHLIGTACISTVSLWLVQSLTSIHKIEPREVRPWRLYLVLLPIVLNQLPRKLSFDESRLYQSAKDAVRDGHGADVLPVLSAWLELLKRHVAEGYYATDYFGGLVEVAIDARIKSDDRIAFISSAFEIRSTVARIIFMGDCVYQWNKLSKDERALIETLLTDTSAKDQKWLQAAALTRWTVPDALLRAVSGGESTDLSTILSNDARLLDACVHLYLGYPTILRNTSKTHSASQFWRDYVSNAAQTPESPYFDIALTSALERASRDERAAIVASVPDRAWDKTSAILLREAAEGVELGEVWGAFLDRSPSPERTSSLLDDLAALADQYLDNLYQIRKWSGFGKYVPMFEERRKGDAALLSVLVALINVADFEDDEDADADESNEINSNHDMRAVDQSLNEASTLIFGKWAEALVALLDHDFDALHGTFDTVKRVFKKFNVKNDVLYEKLDKRRIEALDIKRAKRNYGDLRPDPDDFLEEKPT